VPFEDRWCCLDAGFRLNAGGNKPANAAHVVEDADGVALGATAVWEAAGIARFPP